LDSVADTDSVSVAINAEKIVIIVSNSTNHNMYLYDTYYKFWHRWNTELPIHGAVVFNDIYFLWDRLYTYNKTYNIDYGNNDYTPYIRVIFWEADIFSLKNVIMNKIYLWKNTDPSTSIKWKCHLDWWIYTLQTTFAKLKYLMEAAAYGGDGTMWTNVLWFWIFGWYWVSVSDYIVSAINTVEVPTNFTCTLMEIEMTWDLEFWWMMLGYDVMDPVVTPINSVLWLW
jgi:hypothetical protein